MSEGVVKDPLTGAADEAAKLNVTTNSSSPNAKGRTCSLFVCEEYEYALQQRQKQKQGTRKNDSKEGTEGGVMLPSSPSHQSHSAVLKKQKRYSYQASCLIELGNTKNEQPVLTDEEEPIPTSELGIFSPSKDRASRSLVHPSQPPQPNDDEVATATAADTTTMNNADFGRADTSINDGDSSSGGSSDDDMGIVGTIREVSYHPSSFQLYAPPRQRQEWGQKQILPRVNWGDLFFGTCVLFCFIYSYEHAIAVTAACTFASPLTYSTLWGEQIYSMWRLPTM
jgi:hypothetical protein